MKKLNKILNLILPIFTVVCLILIWVVVAKVKNNDFIVPTVSQTAKKLLVLLGQKKFYRALGFTLIRSIIAFLLSFFLSALFAYLANKSNVAEKLILPFIAITRTLPTIAIASLLLFWTNNQVAPVVITMLVVMPTSYTHIRGALDSVDKATLEAGLVDGAGRVNLFFRIELPQIAPDICSVTGSGLALNLKLMVAAEVLSTTVKSLGVMINMSSSGIVEVAEILALTVVVLILGLSFEFIFNFLSKKAGEWK